MRIEGDYLHPETKEELTACMLMEHERLIDGGWYWMGIPNWTTLRWYEASPSILSSSIRFKLPTINDLRLGDVVKYKNASPFEINRRNKKDMEIEEIQLSILIGRNMWVPIKGGKQ